MSEAGGTGERHSQRLRRILGDAVRHQVPLAPFTTLGIGGPAEWLAEPAHTKDLADALSSWPDHLPLQVVGEGSNLLVPDEGMPGLTVHLGRLRHLHIDETQIRVGAGHRLPTLVNRLARSGLSGLEPLVGVPGSVGGALVMNAGTRDGTMGDRVVRVDCLDHSGRSVSLSLDDLAFGYRESRLQRGDLIVTEAVLQLERRPAAEILKTIREDAGYRRRTQPLDQPNAGSIFRNPPGDAAGRLLDAAGCKGLREGAAQVSTKHANFIINPGGATASQVLALMIKMWTEVRDQFGIELTPEIRLWGDLEDRFRRLTACAS